MTAKPEDMVLLTEEQHKKFINNTKVNLVWFNVNGKFVGPYTYPEQIKGL